MGNKDIKYVALYIDDDGQASGIVKKECSENELEKLKLSHKKDFIILIGWLPIQFYNGGDISQENLNFINYD